MKQLLGLAILVTLLSLASTVGARDSNASKAGANSLVDLVQLRTLAEASGPDAQYRPAERHSTGMTAEQDMAVALVWYRKATETDGRKSAGVFGSGKSDPDSGRPGGGGGNSGDSNAGGSNTGGNSGGSDAGGGNSGGSDAGGGNSGGSDAGGSDTGGSDAGGSNTGGSNTGDRNAGGSSTGGSGTGERDQGGGGQGNSGRGNTGRDR